MSIFGRGWTSLGSGSAKRGAVAPSVEPVDAESRGRALGQALRLATELVVGVGVGGVIGWGLDRALGTAPFLMVVFLILGAAAGILNVMRTAKAMQAERARYRARTLVLKTTMNRYVG